MDVEWLNTIHDALNKNQTTRAHELLRGYVRSNRQDRQGWELLSRVTNDPDERIRCLTRLREIDGVPPAPPPRPALSFALPQLLPTDRGFPALTLPQLPPLPRWLGLGAKAVFFAIVLVLFLLVLIGVLPMFFGYRSLVILSTSMDPTIPQGALIIAQPVASKDLRVGDVIAFSPNVESEIPIVHRIVSYRVKNGTRFYTTRGDNNKRADPVEISLPPTAWIVATHFAYLGYLIYAAASVPGLIVLIVIPLLILLALYGVKWARRIGEWFPPRAEPQA